MRAVATTASRCLLAISLGACFASAAVANADVPAPPGPIFPPHALAYVLLVLLSGAFGGIVQGILRREPAAYKVSWPLHGGTVQLGIVGDLLVGAAAGSVIFFVMESLFGITADNLRTPQSLLKFLSLGVICGYMGSHFLDGLTVLIAKRLVRAKSELDSETQKLQSKLKAASLARPLVQLGDTFRRLQKWSDALAAYDQALALEPTADNMIQKALTYGAQARSHLSHDKSSAEALFRSAIALVNQAIKLEPDAGRGYYNRACYNCMLDPSNVEVILTDLKKAFELTPFTKKIAAIDPDLTGLAHNSAFRHLITDEPLASEHRNPARGRKHASQSHA